jgi:PAS domain S-box-containing protein
MLDCAENAARMLRQTRRVRRSDATGMESETMTTPVDPRYGGLRERTYDHIPVAVVRVDTDRKIVYANHVAKELFGSDRLVGTDFMNFVSDADVPRLETELRRRFEELEGSNYEIELAPPAKGRRIPVTIWAAPEWTAGELVGSIAFMCDLSFEKANDAIRDAIESDKTPAEILKTCASVLQRVIPHACFRVTVVSRNRKHLRVFCEHPQLTGGDNALKWWSMPPFVLEFLRRKDVYDLDLVAWFEGPEVSAMARSDPATQEYLKHGFKHVLVRPVLSERQVVAFAALDTRDARGFTAAELKMCEQLPIAEAVLKALQVERQQELEFLIRLIREMGKVADNIPNVADVLVNELQEHYKWQHVSLVEVDEDAGVFRVVVQAGPLKLRRDFAQPLNEGFLGRAYSSGGAVNEGNIHHSSLEGVYRGGIVGTKSEMCIPIPGVKLRWILNVEATEENAFADEEHAGVEFLLQETGFILERAALLELKTSVLNSIKDAVVQTDNRGRISEVNAAAAELFGGGAEAIASRNLAEFIVASDMASAVLKAHGFPRTEVEMKRLDGTSFPALLSGAQLPQKGGKIFVASDRTFQKRVEQTELLKEVFLRVAMETRAPLALVSTWLRRAAEMPGNVVELVEKSMPQLKKMDVTLERVMRVASTVESSDAECAAVDIRALVEELLDELPQADADIVERHFERDLGRVSAVRRDLQFCINNVVGVLLRSRAQQDTVVVEARKEPRCVALELKVRPFARGDASQNVPPRSDKRALPTEMTYGVEVLRSTLEKMGGTFHTDETLQSAFAIRLPIAQ